MDDHEEAAAAARDPAALAEAPEDLNMAGVWLRHERSMASSRGSLRGQPHGQYHAGVNVPDAAFTPSHCALVQVQTALEIMCQDCSI